MPCDVSALSIEEDQYQPHCHKHQTAHLHAFLHFFMSSFLHGFLRVSPCFYMLLLKSNLLLTNLLRKEMTTPLPKENQKKMSFQSKQVWHLETCPWRMTCGNCLVLGWKPTKTGQTKTIKNLFQFVPTHLSLVRFAWWGFGLWLFHLGQGICQSRESGPQSLIEPLILSSRNPETTKPLQQSQPFMASILFLLIFLPNLMSELKNVNNTCATPIQHSPTLSNRRPSISTSSDWLVSTALYWAAWSCLIPNGYKSLPGTFRLSAWQSSHWAQAFNGNRRIFMNVQIKQSAKIEEKIGKTFSNSLNPLPETWYCIEFVSATSGLPLALVSAVHPAKNEMAECSETQCVWCFLNTF